MLHRKTGLPWVADFRDSMTEDEYPRDPLERKLYRRIEARTVQEATVVVFTTIGTKRMYEERYPVEAHKFKVISNGYDEDAFKAAESRVAARPGGLPRTLLHSGVLYPIERDPRPFFDAIAALKKEGVISAANLQVVLRATSHDGVVRPMLVERGIEDIVKLEPGIPYVNALAELMTTDGLLLFQAANCNHQVPAKLYEYMRSGRPVLAMTDQRGDTAAILRQAGINAIVDIADATAIKGALAAFLRDIADGTAGVATREFAKSFSRRRQTGELAKVFEQVGVT
jgi:glycosyltransferase involved in cell wall biosynthesis